ncbi:MAG: chromosome partitioning protein ParB [Caulobacter sp. 32-67-35]|nr:MAG: chromosome partitioning protein ParB [Caulobacter sp. 32-67-35]
MTVHAQIAADPAAHNAAQASALLADAQTEQLIPLNRLKKSLRNVRKVKHIDADIEAFAASLKAKGLLQNLVVEPEIRDGVATGYYLVTAGEGRRLGLKRLAKRRQIARDHLVRCVVDTRNDPGEVSLDENTSRRSMHPADEFEAFADLADRKGWGAVEIAARFGVEPEFVTKRLRLGAVAPALLEVYREEGLTLEQLMAFAVNPDTERQMQVFAQLPEHNRQTYAIRRAMTETKIAADDRRAVFVGMEAYAAAGGAVLRDLFTEGPGWLEDVALLERLVVEKLEGLATLARDEEGWKWSAAYLDHPHGHGCRRVWEHPLARSPEVQARIDALTAERDALVIRIGVADETPDSADARFEAVESELADLADDYGYEPEEKARAGLFVVLSAYGEPRIERGFVRPEDEPAPEDEGDEGADDGAAGEADDLTSDGGDPGDDGADDLPDTEEEPAGDPRAPLPARLVADLTAHKTAALRDLVGQSPDMALIALTHGLVLQAFGYRFPLASCLDLQIQSRDLRGDGDGIEAGRAGQALAERHAGWARQLPAEASEVWAFVLGLDHDSRMSLLAHCVSLSVNGVHGVERKPAAWLHAERLAGALDLDMRDYWSPTAERYLGRVTKARVLAAVEEAVSPEAAGRLTGLKKDALVDAAQPSLVEARWLPRLLRTERSEAGAAEAARCDEGAPARGTPDADAPCEGEPVGGDGEDGAADLAAE